MSKKIYRFSYTRVQIVHLYDIEAETLEDAQTQAVEQLEEFNLFSKDDESDDPGEIWLDEVEEL
jgi:hypothetical protein